jgi:alcohol dehydrogenase-like protein
MKAIVVTGQAAGTAGMTLVERPEPPAAINDVVVGVHASGFVPTELAWPSTWTDRAGRDRTPSIPGHEMAGVVTALGYGTRGLSVGQRVFGLTDWHRDGTLAEYVAVEARKLAPLPGDVDFTAGASLPISGLTAWQGLFEHGRLQAGQSPQPDRSTQGEDDHQRSSVRTRGQRPVLPSSWISVNRVARAVRGRLARPLGPPGGRSCFSPQLRIPASSRGLAGIRVLTRWFSGCVLRLLCAGSGRPLRTGPAGRRWWLSCWRRPR